MNVVQLVRNFVVTCYRLVLTPILFGVLFIVVALAGQAVIYGCDRHWVVPTILTPSDTPGLDMEQKVLTTKQTVQALVLDVMKLQRGIDEMSKHKASLTLLNPKLASAITREELASQQNGRELSDLNRVKIEDNNHTATLVSQVNDIQKQIEKDLKAGLITKGDAASQLAQLNQFSTGFTDSRVGEVLLRDAVTEKVTSSTQKLDLIDKQIELKSQITQLNDSIALSKIQATAEGDQVLQMERGLLMAEENPYYQTIASAQNLNVAFVPYDNEGSARAGAPVYDCYLNFVVCRKVGTVGKVFPGEQKATNPIFHTDVRGYLVQLNLTKGQSVKSKTLFVGGKPLLF